MNEEKWINLIKVFSKYSLPEIHHSKLNYVPADSQETRDFMMNSPVQNLFYFNDGKQVQVEGRKYYEALKAVAVRTVENSIFITPTSLLMNSEESSKQLNILKMLVFVIVQFLSIARKILEKEWTTAT